MSFRARLAGAAGYYLPSALVILAMFLLWQLAVEILHVKEYILPSPLAAGFASAFVTV